MPKRNPPNRPLPSEGGRQVPSVHDADHRDDIANSERFVAMYRGRALYCAKWKQWLVWDGVRWCPNAIGEVMELAKELAKSQLSDAKANDCESPAVSFARASKNRKRLENMVALAQSDPAIAATPDQFDANDWLLNCPNGTVDLRTGELLQHDPANFITKLCPTEYDPNAVAPVWQLQFLAKVQPDAEVVAFLQRCFGYALTGLVTERIMPIFWGDGANGKSKLIEAYVDVVGPDYAGKVSTDVIVADPRDKHSTGVTDLEGRRLVYCNETRPGEKLNEARLKDLVDAQWITARKLYENNRTFRNTAKLVFCTNHKPRLSPEDDALWNRIVLVPFMAKFHDPDKGEFGPPEFRVDKGIAEKLRAERKGILAWYVKGCLEWQRLGGLQLPASLQRATNDYRAEGDIFTAFIQAWCELGDFQFQESATQLHQAFVRFCGNQELLSQKRFGDRLGRIGVERFRNSRTGCSTWYRGIRLKPLAAVQPPPPLIPPVKRLRPP